MTTTSTTPAPVPNQPRKRPGGGPASAALKDYARAVTGLTGHEVDAVFDGVRRSAADADAPDLDDFEFTLDRYKALVLADSALTPARRASILDRLRRAGDDAREGLLPDGSTWAAMCFVGVESRRRARHRDVDYAGGGTVWATGDENGPYDDGPGEPGPFRIFDVRSARTLVCPCCAGWIRLSVQGPWGEPDTVFVAPQDVFWSSAHRDDDPFGAFRA